MSDDAARYLQQVIEQRNDWKLLAEEHAKKNARLQEELYAALKQRDECLQIAEDRGKRLREAGRSAEHWQRVCDHLLEHCKDPECMECGRIVCPMGEPLHFHHDGCPACWVMDSPEELRKHVSEVERYNVKLAQESHEFRTKLRRIVAMLAQRKRHAHHAWKNVPFAYAAAKIARHIEYIEASNAYELASRILRGIEQ